MSDVSVTSEARGLDSLPWRFRTLNLRTTAGWDELLDLLSGKKPGAPVRPNHRAAKNLAEQLEKLSVASAVIEFPYHDRDFSDDYLAFHGRIFRPGRRSCVRIHFFAVPSEDLEPVLSPDIPDPNARLDQLRSLKDRSIYRGFCVVRPLRDTPIGFTAIARANQKAESGLQLWTKYSTHILGEQFHVKAFPFIEQDGRTGACAQAALWMALRYLWAADDGAWSSMHGISFAATTTTDETNALSVPSGSGGLNSRNMLAAVKGAGRIPHYFSAASVFEDGRPTLKWKNELDPIALACRYLDSNIPVILLLGHTAARLAAIKDAGPGSVHSLFDPIEVQNGHAVTAVGYQLDLAAKVKKPKGDDHLHVASWVSNLVVNNDQLGPYTLLPTGLDTKADKDSRAHPASEYRASDIFGVIVPLPDKVYLSAPLAEEFAWLFLTEQADEWLENMTKGQSHGEHVLEGINKSQLVARTFLTRGYNHYQWLAAAQADGALLELSAALHFPRYVWITEFYLIQNGVPDFAHTVAHIVADATAASSRGSSAMLPNSFIFGHLPGWVIAILTTGRRGDSQIAAKQLQKPHSYLCFSSIIHQDRRQQTK